MIVVILALLILVAIIFYGLHNKEEIGSGSILYSSSNRSSSGRTVLCPYCLMKTEMSFLNHVCPDCAKEGLTDPEVKRNIRGVYFCKKHNRACLPHCPNCNKPLPSVLLEQGVSNLPFSIVGVTSSGKTNLITVVLEELGKVEIFDLDTPDYNTRNKQKENSRKVYTEHRLLDSTQSGERTPQIWVLKNTKKKLEGHILTSSFTIFDGAGEDHENKLYDPNDTICKYIAVSECIILTLDPLILPGVRNQIDPDRAKQSGYSGEKDSREVVRGLARYIKNLKGMMESQILNIPIAVVLTKFDLITNLKGFTSNALIKRNGILLDNNGGSSDWMFNEREATYIHNEIRDWLVHVGEGRFIAALEAAFGNYMLFGVSSFGGAPDAKGNLPIIKPHRVLDPFLWIFHKKGIID